MSALIDQNISPCSNPVSAQDDALEMSCDIAPAGIKHGLFSGPIRPADNTERVGAGPSALAALFTPPFNSPAEIVVVDKDDVILPACPVDTAAMPLLTNRVKPNNVQPRRPVSHEFGLNETPLVDGLFGQAVRARTLDIVILID